MVQEAATAKKYRKETVWIRTYASKHEPTEAIFDFAPAILTGASLNLVQARHILRRATVTLVQGHGVSDSIWTVAGKDQDDRSYTLDVMVRLDENDGSVTLLKATPNSLTKEGNDDAA